MNPPYEITPKILDLVRSISEKIGKIDANHLNKPSTELRKENRIKTIHGSLSIEGNTLTKEQITAILDQKRVIGPIKDVSEVQNAITAYDKLNTFSPISEKSFLEAHKLLLTGLVSSPGKYRTGGVGIVSDNEVRHYAPPAKRVNDLMKSLFSYLEHSEDLNLIKSCVFHYELEFIHPFDDGNGRMGRLWQTLILMQKYPIFEFIPFENLILNSQENYYASLSASDKKGNSTPFIEYMLDVIDESLFSLLDFKSRILSSEDRITYFAEIRDTQFSRKDYMNVFKDISSATASRDLKLAVDLNIFIKSGDKSKTSYILNQST